MDAGLEIIKAILDGAHSNRTTKFFSKYYSPDFIYDCPFCGQMNFEDYCKQITFITAMSEIKSIDVKDIGCCYQVSTDFILIDSEHGKKHELKFKFDYFMTEGIITKKTGHCNPTDEQREFIIRNTFHLPVIKPAE